MLFVTSQFLCQRFQIFIAPRHAYSIFSGITPIITILSGRATSFRAATSMFHKRYKHIKI